MTMNFVSPDERNYLNTCVLNALSHALHLVGVKRWIDVNERQAQGFRRGIQLV